MEKRTVGFDVDNKRYTLKYDFNAVCDIEEMAGMSISAMLSGDRVGMNTIRIVLWGGLKWKLQGITKQAVGELMNKYSDQGGDMTKLANDAIKLLGESVGNKTESDQETDESDPSDKVGE